MSTAAAATPSTPTFQFGMQRLVVPPTVRHVTVCIPTPVRISERYQLDEKPYDVIIAPTGYDKSAVSALCSLHLFPHAQLGLQWLLTHSNVVRQRVRLSLGENSSRPFAELPSLEWSDAKQAYELRLDRLLESGTYTVDLIEAGLSGFFQFTLPDPVELGEYQRRAAVAARAEDRGAVLVRLRANARSSLAQRAATAAGPGAGWGWFEGAFHRWFGTAHFATSPIRPDPPTDPTLQANARRVYAHLLALLTDRRDLEDYGGILCIAALDPRTHALVGVDGYHRVRNATEFRARPSGFPKGYPLALPLIAAAEQIARTAGLTPTELLWTALTFDGRSGSLTIDPVLPGLEFLHNLGFDRLEDLAGKTSSP